MGRRLIQAFEVELNKIKSDDLRQLTKEILLKCCDYICDMPASASGKYHPTWGLGVGGLIRHTKAVCRNTETIMKMMPKYDNEDFDIPYIASILHDCMKYTEYNQINTSEDHPNRIADLIRQHKVTKPTKKYKTDVAILNENLERIAQNAETHMSRWNTGKYSNAVMPLPQTMEHMITAIADMIAAQKYTECKFDDNNNIV